MGLHWHFSRLNNTILLLVLSRSIYIIDASTLDLRYITAINSETGLVLWEVELEEDPFLRGKPVDILWSDDLIIVPSKDQLKSYSLDSGDVIWSYDYTDDFYGIKYF